MSSNKIISNSVHYRFIIIQLALRALLLISSKSLLNNIGIITFKREMRRGNILN